MTGMTALASIRLWLSVNVSTPDVQHWRDRAKESRVLAGQINDALAREMMLRVASNYERMAEQASGRQDQDEGRVR